MKLLGKQTVVAATTYVVVCLFALFLFPGPIERLNSDLLNFQLPAESSTDEVVIIAIDEQSFAALDTQWPWPREYHGMLVERLLEEGAKKIIFDVVFAEPSNEDSDNYFANAIKAAGNVIMASDISETNSKFLSGTIETRPLYLFEEAGAEAGLASVDRDPDMVVRFHPPYPNTLASVASGKANDALPGQRIIKYYGPDHTFHFISFFQLFVENGIPEGAIKDKTVFIGLDLKATPNIQQGQTDTFPTPFSRFNSRVSPGVELHSTIYTNIMKQDWVINPPLWQKVSFLGLATLLVVASCGRFSPVRSTLVLVGGQLIFYGLSATAWKHGNFLPFMLSIPPMVAAFVASGSHAYLTEGRQKQMLKKAFSQYLSPEMVNALIAEPNRLQLGGEKKLMTIMFCDVRGFTSISEKLKSRPEVLTDVINTLLTELSQKILETGGTIDKYMGDCIMAFWNAPVLDPMHAENAVQAARAMATSVDEINQLIEEKEGENFELKIGIGIATGECVVGNMGSKQRFDYTVLGDVVNLASRLEGQTKAYGTTTIICKNTAKAISGEILDTVEIDRIRVKGKQEPETIFGVFDAKLSPEDQATISNYLSEFRRGDFEMAFKTISGSIPKTSPILKFAELMTNRLNQLRGQKTPADWDGVYTAQTK